MRLLRAEEEVEEEYGSAGFPASRSFPRMEAESLAEREFRVAVALQICGLVRGYRECLFFVSASQPVFNRDKFLRNAPALFEEKRSGVQDGVSGTMVAAAQRVLSPRSKRFLSILVNCQHFHQLLETLDFEGLAFFHEVMDTFEEQKDDPIIRMKNSVTLGDASSRLILALQTVEDKIPTYRVDRMGPKSRGHDSAESSDKLFENRSDDEIGFRDDGNLIASFTNSLLQPIVPPSEPPPSPDDYQKSDSTPANDGATHSLSVRYLLELEKNPWRYFKLFDFCGSNEIDATEQKSTEGDSCIEVWEGVKLREAIGEKRYRAWKLAQDQKLNPNDLKASKSEEVLSISEATTALDLTSLLSSVTDDTSSETSSLSSVHSHTKFGKSASSMSPEQQRVADAKDRDLLRRCLERAYDGSGRYRGSGTGTVVKSNSFVENGRDLISEAEISLRNPSAQRFLLSVLSQRSRLENQRKSDDEGKLSRRQASSQSSLSRLQQAAFECLVRLCCAMLDACMESSDFSTAYALLTQTAGFCTLLTKDGKIPPNEVSERDDNTRVVYMATRIGLHPIFADLRLWEKVMNLHLEDSQNEKGSGESTSSSRAPSPSDGQSNGEVKSKTDSAEYEAAVGTIYEMVGYGIPAEELARFATRVSEEYGWFANERGHSLLMLARRLSIRREQTDEGIVAGENGDLEMIRSKATGTESEARAHVTRHSSMVENRAHPINSLWADVAWCHPAASSSSRSPLTKQLGSDAAPVSTKVHQSGNENSVKPGWEYMKRSPVTALAAFGSSVVVTGGLDGSVFLAHTIRFGGGGTTGRLVKGIQLDWGSSGSRSISGSGSYMDGEFGVGAVSCLAAAKGPRYHSSALVHKSSKKGTIESIDEDEVVSAMEGSRIVAGTTGGDLRVWSVKDVYSAVLLARRGDEGQEAGSDTRILHAGDGATSSFIAPSTRKGGLTAIAAGNSHTRLKFSLRGRALSGHRGGVSCIDVPSHIYRPDSLVSGGADGLIKIWSLRAPTGRRTLAADAGPNVSSSMFSSGASLDALTSQRSASSGRGGDALSILSGHTGRILFVKTAWHGDRLLSGGADSTIRVWDVAGGGGKCIHALSGHCGWVTEAHFWGPNTIVSGSTDRSIALWDARVRNHPLFVLRHHQAPISRILVGSRTDPVMVSAAFDGTIASWDFRTLSEATGPEPSHSPESRNHEKMTCTFVRMPACSMDAGGNGGLAGNASFLARGRQGSILSGGFDGVVREWDLTAGSAVNEFSTGHCDAISSLNSLTDNPLDGGGHEPSSSDQSDFGGFVTTSWDGTVRMRKLIHNRR
jgi:WD40 repeat protein